MTSRLCILVALLGWVGTYGSGVLAQDAGSLDFLDEEEPEIRYFFSPLEPVTVGVMGFEGDLPAAKMAILAELVAEEIGRFGELKLVTASDLMSMSDLEKRKKLAGCSEEQCVSEIAGALGVDWLVLLRVGRFGDVTVLNMNLVEVEAVSVASRVNERIEGDDQELLQRIPVATTRLFEPVADRLGLYLERVVTVASRHVQPLAESPSAVTVITREDIQTSGASTVADLMRLVPGMDVVLVSPFHTAVSSRLSWTYSNTVYLVLIDGREANIELLGQPFFEAQPLFVDDIQRIEIVRGPGSALYGANAVAGVISITTRGIPEKSAARLRLAGTDAAGREFDARASSRFGDLGLALSGGFTEASMLADRDALGKRAYKFLATGEYRMSETRRLLLELGVSTGEGLLSTGMGPTDTSFDIITTRLAYETGSLRGQLTWAPITVTGDADIPMEYNGLHLADFPPDVVMDSHLINFDLQWTLPTFWQPMLLMVGAGARASWLGSDELLDAESFSDPNHPDYRKAGVSDWETRAGAFVHSEIAVLDWMTVTAGARLDHNTITGWFLSPRLAAVMRVARDQYLRLGVARAFRKPSYYESTLHLDVEFPEDSPFQEPSQQQVFREFMIRVLGNRRLENEKLLSLDIGYQGEFLDHRLMFGLDLYCNILTDNVQLIPQIVPDATGLPDLHQSEFRFDNHFGRYYLGSELSVRYNPTRAISLLAMWSHREGFHLDSGKALSDLPKNLFTLGGRFTSELGLLGSVYLHTRSEFTDPHATNPAGLLEPYQKVHMDNVGLLIGRLGWRFRHAGVSLESGFKLFLPLSAASPHFRYYERTGGVTDSGVLYGGDWLRRVFTAYLKGAF